MTLPTVNHPTDRPNFCEVRTGHQGFSFSYQTCIAFRGENSRGEFKSEVCENVWGPTTGKHLNYVDGGAKSIRLDREAFIAALEDFTKR